MKTCALAMPLDSWTYCTMLHVPYYTTLHGMLHTVPHCRYHTVRYCAMTQCHNAYCSVMRTIACMLSPPCGLMIHAEHVGSMMHHDVSTTIACPISSDSELGYANKPNGHGCDHCALYASSRSGTSQLLHDSEDPLARMCRFAIGHQM